MNGDAVFASCRWSVVRHHLLSSAFLLWSAQLVLSKFNFFIFLLSASGCSKLFHAILSIPVLILRMLNYYTFVISCGICQDRSPMLFVFFRNGWTLLGPLFFHLNFRIGLMSFKNKNLVHFVWDWVEPIDEFGEKWRSNDVESSHRRWCCVCVFTSSLLPFSKCWWSLHKVLAPLWIYF